MSARVIWKFALDPAVGGQHQIPEGSTFLDLQVQNELPTMWWSVPVDGPKGGSLRTFLVVPTGLASYEDHLHYVGTFQLGGFVGHVFSYEEVPR